MSAMSTEQEIRLQAIAQSCSIYLGFIHKGLLRPGPETDEAVIKTADRIEKFLKG